MKLADILDPRAVRMGLQARDKDGAIEELVDLLVATGGVKDRAVALKALHAREALGSTGIGEGVGLPHGKSESIDGLVAALGTSPEGIEFDSVDGKPVHVIFVLLADTENPGPHIEALAGIAQLVRMPGLVRRLWEARSAEDAFRIVCEQNEAGN